jgi:uncharacterized protein (TIGR02679 family)
VTADLTRITQDPDLAPLWAAIHERLCAGHEPASLARVQVTGLSPAGIATLRSWLDTNTRRRRGTSAIGNEPGGTSVPMRELLAVLGVGAGELTRLAENATGRPIVNRAAARRDAAQLRHELWGYAAEMLPALPGLVARLRTAGIGECDIPARHLINALAKAVRRIPSEPPISLAKLSHDCAGNPHFFDLDTIAGARLISAVAELTGQTEPSRPDLIRALLLGAGVIADRLTATVMLYQVVAVGEGPIDRRLRDSATPVALTLLDLTLHPPALANQILTVVENPSIIEAAIASDSRLPLACTSGQLSSVDHALLQLTVDQGIQLRYSGDLDDSGLRIAEYVKQSYGAELIAMDTATVSAAGPAPSAVPLNPVPQPADTKLAMALQISGHVVFQENDAILDQLLGQRAH